jgi:hypothetical protein
MELIDNINRLLGDDLKRALNPGARLKIAASCFSMYAFEALKEELEQVDELRFIFTSPTFVAEEVTDKIRKERREFNIPKLNRERSLYGSEFEFHLHNKLTQRAIARECADWLRRKAHFMSNRTQAPMQQFACVQPGDAGYARTVDMPLRSIGLLVDASNLARPPVIVPAARWPDGSRGVRDRLQIQVAVDPRRYQGTTVRSMPKGRACKRSIS